jgi:hypothetical protein
VTHDPTTLAQNLAELTRGRTKSPTLSYWPDATMGTPNSFLRGYLLRRYRERTGATCFASMAPRLSGT